jgi:hypothetical protein
LGSPIPHPHPAARWSCTCRPSPRWFRAPARSGACRSGSSGCGPHFNTSHAGNWVLRAIDPASPVGIDVEVLDPQLARIDDFDSVPAPEEQAWLAGLPPARRARWRRSGPARKPA